ncbi:MAG: zinc ribbon domain-containing protein [Acidobacteria bacterium]|nr:zinc ribbon domain-containing protein [Acidobacteriota bacterium]
MPVLCTSCGANNPDSASFCTTCGAMPVVQPTNRSRNPPASEPLPAPPSPYEYEPGKNLRQTGQHSQPSITYAPQPLMTSSSSTARQPINVGLCMLLSFLWTGAGFFFIPDRITHGIILAATTGVIVVVSILIILFTGIGVCCTVPLGLVWWISILIWTYKEADRYNRGL